MPTLNPKLAANDPRASIGIEQPPDLTPSDSKLLDDVWNEVGKRFPRKKVSKKKKRLA